MAEADLDKPDALADFERRQITLLGKTKLVFVAGTGPAVIVMTEMPGISPHVARFARWVRDAGFTVWMPHLFGDAGPAAVDRLYGQLDGQGLHQRRVPRLRRQRVEPGDAVAARARGARPSALRRQGRRRDRHVLHRQLRAVDDARAGDAGAGAVAAVAAAGERRAACTSPRTSCARSRSGSTARTSPCSPIASRATPSAAPQRFAAYQQALGDRFQARVLPDSAANPDAPMKNPHSVVTLHLIDEQNQPTRQAVDEIIGFFKMRLVG